MIQYRNGYEEGKPQKVDLSTVATILRTLESP